MTKSFTIPCKIGNQIAPVRLYVGEPNPERHPLHYQQKYLAEEKGCVIPEETMEAIEKVKKLADRNNISFEDLCYYAITAATDGTLPKDEQYEKYLLELAE